MIYLFKLLCFDSEKIAKIMNENFVNIKMDREERPDIDSQYLTFVQLLNGGGGGWPLNVFLTPDLKRNIPLEEICNL